MQSSWNPKVFGETGRALPSTHRNVNGTHVINVDLRQLGSRDTVTYSARNITTAGPSYHTQATQLAETSDRRPTENTNYVAGYTDRLSPAPRWKEDTKAYNAAINRRISRRHAAIRRNMTQSEKTAIVQKQESTPQYQKAHKDKKRQHDMRNNAIKLRINEIIRQHFH